MVGGGVRDSVVTPESSDAILTDSLSVTSSSIVNPKPIVLTINAIADIPENLKYFFAGFLRIKLISAQKVKTGIHKKLIQNIKRNILFIVKSSFLWYSTIYFLDASRTLNNRLVITLNKRING